MIITLPPTRIAIFVPSEYIYGKSEPKTEKRALTREQIGDHGFERITTIDGVIPIDTYDNYLIYRKYRSNLRETGKWWREKYNKSPYNNTNT
jgi:hypothetical protein